jgi:hypothetical protein
MAFPSSTEAQNLANPSHAGYDQQADPIKASLARINNFLKGVKQVFGWLLSLNAKCEIKINSNQSIANNTFFIRVINAAYNSSESTTNTQLVPNTYTLNNGGGNFDVFGIQVAAGNAGQYISNLSIEWAGNSTGVRSSRINVYRPGNASGSRLLYNSIDKGKQQGPAAPSPQPTTQSGLAVLDLQDLDIVFIEVAQTSGGALDITTQSYLNLSRKI